jgi:ribose transport system substrate-binding protein
MRTVAVITKNRINPAYGGALVGARAVADRFGLAVRHTAPEVPDDIALQVALVGEAVAAGVDAVVLLPAHETGLNHAIGRLERARIPLVLMIGDPTSPYRVSFVGSDNRRIGEDIAAHLFDHLGGQGEVALMDGHPNSIATPERHEGFLAAAARHPGIRICESVTGLFQREPAREAALGLLARHARLDDMVVANDLMTLGVLDALEETGRSLALVGVNGTPDAIAAIKAGRLLATASFDTLAFGALAMEAVARHLAGERVPGKIMLPAGIIDAGNLTAWDRPYEERQLPSWDAALRLCGAA